MSLEIKDNEIFGLLGPNGAGKTTTVLVLSTVLKPTSGKVVVDGYDVNFKPHQVRERIGISFQEPVLDYRLTVAQNLEFHAEACGMPRNIRKKQIEAVLEYLDMWRDRDKKAGRISGGMKRKMEDAKLFVQKPEIAIFDEPTAYLDPPSKHKVWERIKELRENGSTIVLATNMMDEADRLSDRVAIINRGKLVIVGNPEHLKGTIPGGEVIQIKVDGPVDEVKGALKAFDNIINVATLSDTSIARIYLNRSEETLPLIMKTLLEKRIKVAEIDLKKPSLDDVFIHYTGEVV